LADIGKFYGLEYVTDGYYLTCDDDFIYPKDYIKRLTTAIEVYNGRVVVGFHGRKFKYKEPLTCFYRAPAWKQISTKETQNATLVHVIGTGVMGFDVTKVRYDWRQWHKHKYMSDLNFSMFCAHYDIPMMCISKPENWLVAQRDWRTDSICETQSKDDSIQTKIANNIKKIVSFAYLIYKVMDKIEKRDGQRYKFRLTNGQIVTYVWNIATRRALRLGQIVEVETDNEPPKPLPKPEIDKELHPVGATKYIPPAETKPEVKKRGRKK
jgi:hypothetical protein